MHTFFAILLGAQLLAALINLKKGANGWAAANTLTIFILIMLLIAV